MSLPKLYGVRISPFVEKVHRALRYKGIDYEAMGLEPLTLRRVSPVTGKMPVLEIDGALHHDSTFILRELDRRQPDPPLYSPDPREAAGQRLLEDWCDESLYFQAFALRWTPESAAATTRQLAEATPFPLRLVVPYVLPRQLRGMARAQGLGRLPGDVLVAELGRHLDDLLTVLGDRPFLHADAPSAADFSLYGMLAALTSGPTPQAEALLADRPAFADWRKRVEELTGGP